MPEFRYLLSLTAVVLFAPIAAAQSTAAPVSGPSGSVAPPVVPATVTTAPDVQPAPVPGCELHVWPAARVGAVTQGMGAGFGILGALIDSASHADQNKRDTAFITGALDARAQARVLRELDLPTRLHLPPSLVVIHDQGIEIQQDNPHRLSDSTAQCYTEFVVRGLSYFKNVAYSGQMRTFLEVRRFDGATIKVDFRDSKHENLQVKLPKEGEDTSPATDALLSAFHGDVTFFTDKFARKST